MSITVQINDHERVTINADPKNVKTENGSLVIRRDNVIVARFRRHIAWWSDDNSSA